VAILRAAQALAATSNVTGDLSTAIRRELDTEANVAVAYASLFSSVRARAEDARKRADVRGVEEAIAALKSGDRDLGARRPQGVEALLGELRRSAGVHAHASGRARSIRKGAWQPPAVRTDRQAGDERLGWRHTRAERHAGHEGTRPTSVSNG
jgi:hypothetical protein